MNVDLIGPYRNSIRQQHPGGTFVCNNVSLTYMTMINLATGWLEIVNIPTFGLEEVALGNDEYIYKSSTRVIHLFNNTWLFRYPRPRKVFFGNGSEFKQDFTPLLNDFGIKPVLT